MLPKLTNLKPSENALTGTISSKVGMLQQLTFSGLFESDSVGRIPSAGTGHHDVAKPFDKFVDLRQFVDRDQSNTAACF